jgi:hypothetical protein
MKNKRASCEGMETWKGMKVKRSKRINLSSKGQHVICSCELKAIPRTCFLYLLETKEGVVEVIK